MAETTVEEVANTDPLNAESTDLARKQLARWVSERWDEAETSARQEADYQSWDSLVDAYWGEVAPESNPSYRQPVLTTEMRDLILHEAQEITDTKPKVHVTGAGLDKQLLYKCKDLLNALWTNCNVRGALLDAIVWSNILPAGWVGVYWDENLNDGLGDISVSADDPRQILPAPQALDDIRWPYVIKYDWLDLYAIKQRWPDFGHLVQPETPPVSIGKRPPKSGSSPYLGPMFSSPSNNERSTSSIPQARVLSIWVRDPATEIKYDPIRDPETNAITKLHPRYVRKYPRGRFVVTCGEVTLEDIKWRLSSFPLFRIIPQPTIGGFFQSPKVRDLRPIQQAVDKSWEQNIQNGERCNEGVWFTTGETGVDPSNFTPMPGMVVQGEQGSSLDMKAPQAFPEQMLQMPERLAGIMRRKMGQTAARSGGVQGANIGQGLIETEISQAETPTRLAAGLLYQSCRRIAQCILETAVLMYRSRRDVAWMDAGSMKELQWEPITEDITRRLISHLDESSFVPRSETLEKGMIMKLGALGIVGPEYILKHIQIPDVEEANEERKSQLFQVWRMMQQKGSKSTKRTR